jgi:hypothetical protein
MDCEMAYETVIEAIVERANDDTEFRGRLLADPRGTLETELGLRIPEDWEVSVSLDATGGLTIEVLNDEISDELLDSVSGGICRQNCGTCGRQILIWKCGYCN